VGEGQGQRDGWRRALGRVRTRRRAGQVCVCSYAGGGPRGAHQRRAQAPAPPPLAEGPGPAVCPPRAGRRFVRTLLEDRAVLIKAKLTPLFRHPAASLYRQLVDLFTFYMAFPINDHTGEALSDEEVTQAHYDKVRARVRVCVRPFVREEGGHVRVRVFVRACVFMHMQAAGPAASAYLPAHTMHVHLLPRLLLKHWPSHSPPPQTLAHTPPRTRVQVCQLQRLLFKHWPSHSPPPQTHTRTRPHTRSRKSASCRACCSSTGRRTHLLRKH